MIYKLGEARIIICKYNLIMRPRVLRVLNITPPNKKFWSRWQSTTTSRTAAAGCTVFYAIFYSMAYFGHWISKRGTTHKVQVLPSSLSLLVLKCGGYLYLPITRVQNYMSCKDFFITFEIISPTHLPSYVKRRFISYNYHSPKWAIRSSLMNRFILRIGCLLRGSSHQLLLAPSISIFVKSGRSTSSF